MTQTPAAGWHPDPQDPSKLRYWDGTAWTEHTAPTAPAASPAPGAPAFQQPGPTSPKSDERPWFKKKRWIASGAILALVVIASLANGGGSTPDDPSNAAQDKPAADASASTDTKSDQSTPSSTPKPKPKAEPKAIRVKAVDIIKQYEDNELAADSKYKGKKVAVSGVISKIDTEMFDENDYTVDLNGGGDYEILNVTAYDVPKKDIAKLQKGQRVTVVCDFKDGGDLGINVNHCKMA